MKKNIEYISIEKIYPHKDNPRKDLGDLTELADSIKSAGIFQNLTVVPRDEETYTVIIGHRRLAASKLAGLKEVPCVIMEMSEKDQVATMLLENMQRSDLTIYEQAEGFQLMLDFGESYDTISEKTGFSQSTVRRRVKLLELDKDELKKSMNRNVSLEDYAKLDKIKDIELRNEVLKSIGTKNFEWNLRDAEAYEKRAEKSKAAIEKLNTFAEEVETAAGLTYIRYIDDANFEIPDDAKERKYYYTTNSGRSAYLYAEPTAEEKQKEADLKKSEAESRELLHELDDIAKRAYELRRDFIKNAWGKKDPNKVMKFAYASLVKNVGSYRILTNADFCECAGLDPEEEGNVINDIMSGKFTMHPERSLLIAAYAAFHDSESETYHTYSNEHRENIKLDIIYDFFCDFGYQMSDEEIAYKDGTHKLFRGEE